MGDLSAGALPQRFGVTSGTYAFGHRALAAIGWLLRRRRGPLAEPDATRAAVLVVGGTFYCYLAAASSLGEYGENMRFRLGVEPLIWTLTAVGAAGVLRLLRGDR